MARETVVKYQSDLSGVDIALGKGVQVKITFESDGEKQWVADLNEKEAKELITHLHAREQKKRGRKAKENGSEG